MRRRDGDAAAAALTAALELLVTGLPDAWSRREPGALAAVTAVSLPTLNGVWVDGTAPDGDVVTRLLDAVAATGLAHCLQLRRGAGTALAQLAARAGMRRADDIPLMVLDDPRSLNGAGCEGLVIRELAPVAAGTHAAVAAAGFGAPEEHFRRLITPRLLELSGVRCYLGQVDGDPVVTGLGLTVADSVGIFNIATLSAHRHRGYGTAITARAVQDGLNAGARWAWLQSSPAGYPVYEGLGFRTVEHWHCWLTAD